MMADKHERSDDLSADLLTGAEEIAIYLFGDAKHKRRVYHLVEKGGLPVVRLGTIITARRSTLRRFWDGQEQAVFAKHGALAAQVQPQAQ
jgi:hypothetical protein